MATLNPFDLLVDDDTEDPNQLIAKVANDIASKPAAAAPAGGKKGVAQAQAQPAKSGSARLPSKPLPPSQAVRETKNDGQRGERGVRGGGRGGGRDRGGRGFNRDSAENEKSFGNSNGFGGGYRAPDDGEAGKDVERRGYGGGFRGGRRVSFNDGDGTEGERPRRVFERRSGTGRGSEFKREGSGRGNWGTPTDEIAPEPEESVVEGEKVIDTEKQPGQEDTVDTNKDANEKDQEEKEREEKEREEKEREEKEMTLEEYEKVLEEKRKALLALKPEERKVNLDKELESMQLLSNKKNDEDAFAKLGSEKDKRKDATEKAKKSLTINEFLKPAEGETYYRGGGRGRGRGRGRGGNGGNNYNNNFVAPPSIQDVGQFPSLGGK